ncbi:MAG TPA: hybrid sensor histidine kinase/response regulator [Rhodospirillales bacterium]|nr:hybrid sensor histidine kinase/response regulator [Rhodospirillales bacterium]
MLVFFQGEGEIRIGRRKNLIRYDPVCSTHIKTYKVYNTLVHANGGAVLLYRIYQIVFVLVIGIATSASADNTTLAINLGDQRAMVSVAGHLGILEDPDGHLDFATISSESFSDKFSMYDEIPQFSRTRSVYWARFSLRNKNAYPINRILVLNYPNHQKATLFMPQGNGRYRQRILDAGRMMRDVDIAHRLPVYLVNLSAGETTTYYWRIESPTVRPNIEIWMPSSFLERRVSEEWWYLVFLGVTLATWIYSTILAVSSRSRLYTALFIFASFALSLQLVVQGHQYLLFGRYGGALTFAFMLLQSWTAGALGLFSSLFLGIEGRSGVLRTGLRTLIVAFFAGGLWSLIDYHNAMIVYQLGVLVGAPLLMVVAIRMAWSGSQDARLYLAGWSPFFVVGILIALNGTGIIGSVVLGEKLMVAFIPTTLLSFGFSIMYRVVRERTEKERFMSSVEMKSSFLATMSHEIRTPLTGVLGMADLLHRTSLSPRQQDYVSTIRSSGKMLVTLLDDVLQLSKSETGKLSARYDPFDPRQMIDSLARLFSGQARNKGLDLQVVIDPGVPATLIGDVGRIRQIMLNLIGNAIKFTSTGYVRIEMLKIKETEAIADGPIPRYQFSVKDSGIGISEDSRAHLFEKFSQADKTISHYYGGTGLGLAISRQLAEEMGGEVDYVRDVETGSKFFLSLSLAEGSSQKVEEADPSIIETTMNIGRVLVVDDVETNRAVIVGLLNAAGIFADSASTGRRALDKLAPGGYDLVLMDIHMPEMDGMTATRRLRKAGNAIPIIGLSASVLPEERQQYLAAGMNEVLNKPIGIDLLVESIRRVLSQENHAGNVGKKPQLVNKQLQQRHREVLGGEKWAEMMDTFRADASTVFNSLKDAVRKIEANDILIYSHRLSGMAGFLGFDALSAEAQSMNDAVQRENVAITKPQIEVLEEIYLSTIRQLG